MFESDIERTKIELSELLITHQPFTYLRDILRMPALTQVYKDYFHAEFTWWLYEERTQRSARTHFDNDDPNAQRILQELDEQYFKNARFDHEQLTAIIDTSVKSILNYTVRPRTTLKWYVFRGEPTKAIYEVYLRMMYFSDYSYLRDGFVEWLTNKGLSRNSLEIISVLEYEKFIKKIDDDTILELSPSQFTALINPIFDFFADSTKPIEHQVVPIEAIIIFLDDKEIHVIAQKLERMLYQQGVRYISKPMFLQVVDEVLNELEIQETDEQATSNDNSISSVDYLHHQPQSADTFAVEEKTQADEPNNAPSPNIDDFRSELSSVIGLSSTPLPPVNSILAVNEIPTNTTDISNDEVQDLTYRKPELIEESSYDKEIPDDIQVISDEDLSEQILAPSFTGLPYLSEIPDSDIINPSLDIEIEDNRVTTESDDTSLTINYSNNGDTDSSIVESIDGINYLDSYGVINEISPVDEQAFLIHDDSGTESIEVAQSSDEVDIIAVENDTSNQYTNLEIGEEATVNSVEEATQQLPAIDSINEEVVAENAVVSESLLPKHFTSDKEYRIGDDAISYLATMMNSGSEFFVSAGAERAVLMPFDREAEYSLSNASQAVIENAGNDTLIAELEHSIEEIPTESSIKEESLITQADLAVTELIKDSESLSPEHTFSKTVQPSDELQSLFTKIDKNTDILNESGMIPEANNEEFATETIESNTELPVENNIAEQSIEPNTNIDPVDLVNTIGVQLSESSIEESMESAIENELSHEHTIEDHHPNTPPIAIEHTVIGTIVDDSTIQMEQDGLLANERSEQITKSEQNTVSVLDNDSDLVLVSERVDSPDTDSVADSQEQVEVIGDSTQQDGQIFNIISKVLGTSTPDSETIETDDDNTPTKDSDSSGMGLGRGLSSLLSDSAKEVISATVATRPSVSTFIESKQRETFIKKLCSRNESRFDELIAKLDKTNNWKQALASLDQFYAEQGVDPQSSLSGELKMAVYKRFINS
jgi:hypothetical protein